MDKIYESFCLWIVKKFGKTYYAALTAQNEALVKELNAANEKIAELVASKPQA